MKQSNENDVEDTVTLEAKTQCTIKCGKGSITIKKDGTIILKGVNIISKAQKISEN